MSIVYRKGDCIKIGIADLIFHISPLPYAVKTEVVATMSKASGVHIENVANATQLLVKHAVKKVEGLCDINGDEYKLECNEDGTLKDECVDDLLNIEVNSDLADALNNFIRGVPSKLVDQATGEELKSVKIIPPKGDRKK